MTLEAVAGLGDGKEKGDWGFYPFGVQLLSSTVFSAPHTILPQEFRTEGLTHGGVQGPGGRWADGSRGD